MATVTRWTPFQQMERMQRELDRMFGGVAADRQIGWLPPVDIEQTEKATILKLDLPGMSRDQITIEAHDGSLMISGEREDKREQEHEGYVVRERALGRFARSFSLPPHAKVDEITATMNDGVLSVTIPRPAQESPQTIAVS